MPRWDEPEQARAYAQRVANHRGWVVNSDTALVVPILSGLVVQTQRFGKPYCPCRDIEGSSKDSDVVCPCAYADDDIKASGQCFCGLFLSPGKDPASVSSIPERRP